MLKLPDSEHLLAAALDACRVAGVIHREHFRSAGLTADEIDKKADASPVTQADRGSEAAIREALRRATPDLGLLGEEYGQEGDERDRWVIDPLDATRNFVAGLPWFATLIGLELDGELVLGVVHAALLDATWCAVRGGGAWAGSGTDPAVCRERRLRVSETATVEDAFVQHGGLVHFQHSGLWPAFSDLVARAGRTRGFGDWWGHMLVAEGRCDAMLEGVVHYHDVAAIKPILEEAGGVFLTRGGAPLGRGFKGPTLSSNRNLAGALAAALGF